MGGSVVKKPYSGLIPESGRSPGEGNGTSILAWEIPWTGGGWATVHGVTKEKDTVTKQQKPIPNKTKQQLKPVRVGHF